MNLLSGFLLLSLLDDGFAVPERGAKYRYQSLLVIFPVAVISLGIFIWLSAFWPWWAALPLGIVAIALGFLVVLRIVSRIVPKKFPTDEDS
jgi:hypothetical protein